MSSLEVPGYFKGTDIAAFVVVVVLVLPVNFNLYLNDSESAMLPFGSSTQYCQNFLDMLKKLSLYSNKLYTGLTTSKISTISTFVLSVSPMELVNGVQFLNITHLSCLSSPLTAVMAFLTSLYGRL